MIVRALYGLKSAGSSFGRHLEDCMRHLGYKPCLADPDLWYKPMKRPDDNFEYYSYMLLYVDDCLCIHHNAKEALKELDHYFPMKKGSIGSPDVYLGSKLRKVHLDNGVAAWAMSSSKYVQEAISNVEKELKYMCHSLPRRASAPWPSNYISETDDTPLLPPERVRFYQ